MHDSGFPYGADQYFGRGDDGAGAARAESRRSPGASVLRPKLVDQQARLSRAGLAAAAIGRYLNSA